MVSVQVLFTVPPQRKLKTIYKMVMNYLLNIIQKMKIHWDILKLKLFKQLHLNISQIKKS